MELRQLRYFIRAAELLNFTNAAAELYVSQSTLSQQIKQLEDNLCVSLFDRLGKRVRLTEAGNMFLSHARKTLREADEGRQVLKDLVDLKTGNLTIGATYGLTAVLVEAIAVFSLRYPDVSIQIIFGSTEYLLECIYTAKIDCMLSFMPVQSSESLEIKPLFSAALSLVVHQSNELAKRRKITLRQLARIQLALPARSYSVRNHLEVALSREGMNLPGAIEVNDINTLLHLADTGHWSTVLMSSSLFNFPSLRAIPLEGTDMQRQATITLPLGVYRKKSLVALSEIIFNKS
ncbi:MAG TPA: LysR substrate-binding domain-containing protein [Puia sp.]|uniref:LysR substrate-binding domain-containing protein n=1 Tax=Puia sp. TaxID=2045100 RepID=UPI002C14C968|nr:LysR substrate-binding domain-containing protein [Puia sp.]HVU99589.1 LysR substrate-binding domain-containing protein [Puia sp.]